MRFPPWSWDITFQLSDSSFSRSHFVAQGVAHFIDDLAEHARWEVERGGRRFVATYKGAD